LLLPPTLPEIVATLTFGSCSDVEALNATTGASEWTLATTGSVFSSPAVAIGVVYIASNGGKVYAVKATTAAVAWSDTPGGFLDSPSVADGFVYLGSTNDTLYLRPLTRTASASVRAPRGTHGHARWDSVGSTKWQWQPCERQASLPSNKNLL
jgi:outer membrane protein assembly factor BamB